MKKVCLALSGGVDSTVSAIILKNLKFSVTGTFMKNWESNNSYCNYNKDVQDVQNICEKLDINFNQVNFSYEYWQKVFKNFILGYKKGFTPNPDVLCNKAIKFNIFLQYALNTTHDFIATGHYVRKTFKNGIYQLLKAKDITKDQSYFLYNINQYQLSKSLFPVGNLLKTQVRNIAFKKKLFNFNKKDSTGICFIGAKNFSSFIKQYIKCIPGPILDMNNNFLGLHEGYPCYTIGQRKGLKIGGLNNNKPWFVHSKNIEKNIIFVAQGKENKIFFTKSLYINRLNWISSYPPKNNFLCTSKVRHGVNNEIKCMLKFHSHEILQVIFEKKIRTPAKEQSIVFYQDQICLGGGIIN